MEELVYINDSNLIDILAFQSVLLRECRHALRCSLLNVEITRLWVAVGRAFVNYQLNSSGHEGAKYI